MTPHAALHLGSAGCDAPYRKPVLWPEARDA
jgi:hypothetical protein